MDRELVDLGSGQPEQARQQRDRSQHRHHDGQCDGDTHGGHRREAGEEESEDGDHHGRAGEQHGLPGGGVRGSGRVLDAHALVQVLTVAGDDEQCVVDADAETDHHAQDQRELGDVHEGGEHADAGGADEQAHECSDDRQAHGDDGAEGDQQHDDGDGDADELAAGVLLVEESELPGELGLHAAVAGVARCGLGVVQLGDGELVERVGDVDVGGLPVLAECR